MNWLNKAKLMDMKIISTGSSWELLSLCWNHGEMTFKSYVTRYNSQWQFMAQQRCNHSKQCHNNVFAVLKNCCCKSSHVTSPSKFETFSYETRTVHVLSHDAQVFINFFSVLKIIYHSGDGIKNQSCLL